MSANFDTIDKQFFESFQKHLINKGNLNDTTIRKQLSTLKTFLYKAKSLPGIVVSDKFKDFKIGKGTALPVIALTEAEFETLFNVNLKSNNPKLSNVRDILALSCATGLRMSDLEQLEWGHIKENENIIEIRTIKTNQLLRIPLNFHSGR